MIHPNIYPDGKFDMDLLGEGGCVYSMSSVLQTFLTLLDKPHICEENIPKNDKGKEEITSVPICANPYAYELWKNHLKEFTFLIKDEPDR